MQPSSFETRNVLVTGANGFIGTYLTEALLAQGAKVGALGLPGLSFHPGAVRFEGNLRDADFVKSAIEKFKPEFAFHLAAFKERSPKIEAFNEAISTNLVGTLNLLTALENASGLQSVVVVGTAEEYGNAPVPFEEERREAPVSAYSFSKVCVTQLSNILHRLYGLPTIVIRPTIAFGPRQSTDMFLPALIKSIVSGHPFRMTYGKQTRDYIYVADLVEALTAAALNPAAIGQTFNIGGGQSISIAHLAMQVERKLGKAGIVQLGAIDYRPSEIMHYEVNIEKAKAVFGWKPRVSLQEGLDRTIDYYRVRSQH